MDRHFDPVNNCVSREFKEGVDVFIAFASNQTSFIEGKTMLCPCARCQNRKQRDSRTVSRHLYRVGFKSNYYLWSSHGENYYDVGESSTGGQFMGEGTLHTEEEPYQENYPNVMEGVLEDVMEPMKSNMEMACFKHSKPLMNHYTKDV